MTQKKMTVHALEVTKLSKRKEGCMSHFKFKAMLIAFFNIQGVVMAE
jgi:hypothetical protein